MYTYIYTITKTEYDKAIKDGAKSIIGKDIKARHITKAKVSEVNGVYFLTYEVER